MSGRSLFVFGFTYSYRLRGSNVTYWNQETGQRIPLTQRFASLVIGVAADALSLTGSQTARPGPAASIPHTPVVNEIRQAPKPNYDPDREVRFLFFVNTHIFWKFRFFTFKIALSLQWGHHEINLKENQVYPRLTDSDKLSTRHKFPYYVVSHNRKHMYFNVKKYSLV